MLLVGVVVALLELAEDSARVSSEYFDHLAKLFRWTRRTVRGG